MAYGRFKRTRRGLRRVRGGGSRTGYRRKVGTYARSTKLVKTYRKRATGPRANPTKAPMRVYRRPLRKLPRFSSHPRRKKATSHVISRTPGSYTISGQGVIIVSGLGEQGALWGQTGFDINSGTDLWTVIAAAALRQQLSTVSFPFAPEFSPDPPTNVRFFVTGVQLSITVTNQGQTDCTVTCYPWTQRYTGTSSSLYWTGPETYVTSTGIPATAANSVAPEVMGTTPFVYPSITQSCRIGKPKTVFLQGGQHKTFTMSYHKNEYWSKQRLLPPSGDATSMGFANVTRGMSFTTRGMPNNSVTNPLSEFGYGTSKCLFLLKKTYHYESVLTNITWRDTNTAEYAPTGGQSIILPQTGAVVANPAFA